MKANGQLLCCGLAGREGQGRPFLHLKSHPQEERPYIKGALLSCWAAGIHCPHLSTVADPSSLLCMELLLCISPSRCAIAHLHLLCRGAVGHSVSVAPMPTACIRVSEPPWFPSARVFRMRSSEFYLLCHSYTVSCKLVLGEAMWRSSLICRQPSFKWDQIVPPSKGFDYWCENTDARIQK